MVLTDVGESGHEGDGDCDERDVEFCLFAPTREACDGDCVRDDSDVGSVECPDREDGGEFPCPIMGRAIFMLTRKLGLIRVLAFAA
eukprot:1707970-Rhodomonas_salina.1